MLIDGKAIANQIQQELKEFLASHPGTIRPCLAVILVGEHPPSLIYVSRKTQACADIGIQSIRIDLPSNISEADLIHEIEKLNKTPNVNGILLQLPLPQHIRPLHVINHIHPTKDVDGLHPTNVGKMLIGETDGFLPCTPYGIQTLLKRSHLDITGKHVVIIGRSNLVGKPLAAILMQNHPAANATVTIAHSQTKHLKEICRSGDIVVAAIGQPKFVTADMVKEQAIVIDVGINKIVDPTHKSGYRIVGDVDFEHVQHRCAYITPVPGGVGPMTIAMLLSNTVKSFMRSQSLPFP